MLTRARDWWPTLATFALIAATGFSNGGYFPGTWGWATLAAAWAAAAVLLSRERVELARPALAAAGLLLAFTVWTALSVFWSVDVTNTVLEAERNAVYAAALLAAVLLARTHPERLLYGAWSAAVALCGWALATRLVPDRWGVTDTIAGYRLSGTIGYWNSLGLLAAMGTLLALGIAARSPNRVARALAAASVPVLVTTLYFTYSRGAWLALGFGLLAYLAIATRRLQLVAAAVPPVLASAIAVWRGSLSPALTTTGAPLSAETHQGHRLVLVVALAALAAAAGEVLLTRFDRPRALRPRTVRGLRVAGGAGVVVAIIAVFATFGSPTTIAKRGWHAFADTPTSGSATTSLNGRLFSFYGSGRVTQWQVAWHQIEAYPLLGSGAATYELYWNRHRPVASRARNVHNLYLETLADLGPVGLVVLLGTLLLPLVSAMRRRDGPLTMAAFGAFSAFALHAVVDWDWQIGSVAITGLICAAALLGGRGARLSPRIRSAATGAACLLAATGLYVIATRIPLNAIGAAAGRGNWPAARKDAGRAAALAPWSSEPWLMLGEDEIAADRADLALPVLRRAVARDRRNWVAWFDLARVTAGAPHDRALAEARRLNPRSPEVASLLP